MNPSNMKNTNLYALILAGGVGSRFWPFSRELEPKQFMKIFGERSLLQDTIKRLQGIVNPKQVYIISNKSYFYEIKRQVEKFHILEGNIILEPEGKNTAPAIGLCARLIGRINPEAMLIVLPSDHCIKDVRKFRSCLLKAVKCALEGYLVTLGIRPREPALGYGYIKTLADRHKVTRSQGYYRVEKFLEKPSLEKAKKYAAGKNYFWNSGMFIWKADVFMAELKRYLPKLYSQLLSIESKDTIGKAWPQINSISVDYGIMERSQKIALVPADFDWTDLGSWDAVNDILPKDKKGNVIHADSMDLSSERICVFSRSNRLISTIGLKDLIIADTPDALLVCDRHRAQEVKKIVENLKSLNRKEHIMHLTDKRPWGSYTVLQIGGGFKIKLVEIAPGKRLSLQRHSKRAEHWVVVCGLARVTCGNTVKLVKSNESIYIPKGTKHRLENPASGKLQIVEVQTGNYLEEDDIERFEDDFNR